MNNENQPQSPEEMKQIIAEMEQALVDRNKRLCQMAYGSLFPDKQYPEMKRTCPTTGSSNPGFNHGR